MARAADVDAYVADTLEGCPSDAYIIVSQPGVSIADFTQNTAAHFARWIRGADSKIKTSTVTENVHGVSDVAVLQSHLEKQCKANAIEIDGQCKGKLPSDHYAVANAVLK